VDAYGRKPPLRSTTVGNRVPLAGPEIRGRIVHCAGLLSAMVVIGLGTHTPVDGGMHTGFRSIEWVHGGGCADQGPLLVPPRRRASEALEWDANPPPGPASTATTKPCASTCKPSSTTSASRHHHQSRRGIDNFLSIGVPQAPTYTPGATVYYPRQCSMSVSGRDQVTVPASANAQSLSYWLSNGDAGAKALFSR
jgi:hypothetical protein